MIYKSDYGLKLQQDGISKEVRIHFPQFKIYSITILDYEKYLSRVEIPFNNQIYTLVIDFSHEQLQEMLNFASINTTYQINKELDTDMFTQRIIEIDEPFTIDVTISLGELQKNQQDEFVPFKIVSINNDLANKNEPYFSKEEILRALNMVNLYCDIELLYEQLKIVNNEEYSFNRIYIQCYSLLDLIVILELKNIALNVYENQETKLDINISDYYLKLIVELEIDFKLFILLAGEDFLMSDYYEYNGDLGYEQVIKYLINKQYEKVLKKLKLYYKDSQTLLIELIKEQYFYNSYLKAIQNLEIYKNNSDYTEVMKLYQWSNTGFNLK